MSFLPTIDHTLNKCMTERNTLTPNPYIPKRVFENIDTQISVAVPPSQKLRIKNFEKFVNKGEIKKKCEEFDIHDNTETFTPPIPSFSTETYVFLTVLMGVVYILK